MKILLSNGVKKEDITNFVPAISISGDYMQAARTSNFSVLNSPFDINLPSIDIQLGYVVQIYEDEEEIFYGYVFERNKSTDGNAIDIMCYDSGVRITKNKYSYKFSDISPEDITKKLCSDINISVGNLAKTGITIKRNFLGLSFYDIIIGSYYQASIKNGKKYIIRFNNNKLNVIEKGDISTAQILQNGNNLLTSNVSESISNMVNSVAVFNENNNLVTTIKNEENIKLYGLMQEYYKVNKDDDYNAKAKSMLKDIERKIQVTNFGNIRCITGNTVVVREPYTGLYGVFYIDSDTHSWKNGIYTNSLVLNFQNLMDEKEAGEIPSADVSSEK